MAVHKGDLTTAMWLSTLGIQLQECVVTGISMLRMLQWCMKANIQFQENIACNLAAMGKLNELVWLHEIGYKIPKEAKDHAEENGYNNIVKWLSTT